MYMLLGIKQSPDPKESTAQGTPPLPSFEISVSTTEFHNNV